ncbi:MAG: SDR family NAD(P)-dependent oxidoreductase [Sphingobacteriia bacterium]|nr:SDR family NAD(P)-dependent oxidoreductase [Sphingobacteriia bacterium]
MSADQKPVWLITGASRGLGKAIALKALAAGHQVGAAVRNLDDGKDLVDAYPETCRLFVAELSLNGAASGLAADVLKHFGTVDYLINNAGYGVWGMAEELEMENYYHQMQVNFFALVELTKSLIPVMRTRGSGMIINVSSLAGLRGMQGLSAYNASKFAVEGFTEAIAQELTPFGVRVSVIEPGPYRTDWAGNSLVKTSGVQKPSADSPYYELNQAAARRISLSDGKQPGDPDQIASVLLYAATAPELPLHMLMGDVCIEGWEQRKSRFEDPTFISKFPHDKFTL